MSASAPREAFLRYVAAVIEMDEAEQASLRDRLRIRTLAKGEALVREGDRCREIAYLAEGAVQVTTLHDGDLITLYFATEGQMVTDYESVLTGAPARMTVETLEPSTIAVLPADDLAWAYREIRQGERFGRWIAEQLFLATHRRLTSFYLDSAEDRYRRLVAEHPGLVQRVPQHLIASYVGVRPQSLSRIRRRIAEG